MKLQYNLLEADLRIGYNKRVKGPENDAETLSPESSEADAGPPRVVLATIAFHPDLERIGERLVFGVGGGPIEISRQSGLFRDDNDVEQALDDPYMSRQPVCFSIDWRRGLTISAARPGIVTIDEHPLTDPIALSVAQLERGVALTLSKRIVLLLHTGRARPAQRRHQLVGCSAALDAVRESIDKVADVDVPVLLRGETGVGKDMVARAIHAASNRAEGPYVAVNMGAIAPTTAVSELFGHARGSFTGANADHVGLFERASGGTIFLDEIGETPDEIQPMLLRVLESGEYLPVGASEARRANVRIVAATDADLEGALDAGTFRSALLHRLSGFEIEIAPLRRRREDIGPLVAHFVGLELARLGQEDRLSQSSDDKSLWFRAKLMRTLLKFDWPGNVRQLLNAVRQLLIASRDLEALTFDARLKSMLSAMTTTSEGPKPSGPMRLAELTDEQVTNAMRANRWAMGPSAKALGIPRSTLYDFIDKSPTLQTAKDVDADVLRDSFSQFSGDLEAMSSTLQVSKRGIRLRLREVGLLD